MPFAYRLVWYLTCTVFLLWMANSSRRSVSTAKIIDILAWMFVIAAFGGLAGVLLPGVELRSFVELLLPGGVRGNSFVKSLVHPALADMQNVLGRPEARPKAPFPFANTWGSVTALSLPFFLVAWVKDGTRRRRLAAGGVLLVATVPIVYSLNRGLWACLVAGVLILVVLHGWRGGRGTSWPSSPSSSWRRSGSPSARSERSWGSGSTTSTATTAEPDCWSGR